MGTMGIKLFVDAFCKPDLPVECLKAWSFARHLDPHGSGGCLIELKALAQALGVKPDTARRYLHRAWRHGFFRHVAERGEGYYVRYRSAYALGRELEFNVNAVVEVPLKALRWTRGKLAAVLAAIYTQFRAFKGAKYRNRKLKLKLPSPQLLNRWDWNLQNQSPLLIDPQLRSQARQPWRLYSTVRPSVQFVYSHDRQIRTGQLVSVEFEKHSPRAPGNHAPLVIGYARHGGVVYALLNGDKCDAYGASQQLIGKWAGLTQPQVSRYLRGFKHCRTRLIVANPGMVLDKLRSTEQFDPEDPWITRVEASNAETGPRRKRRRIKTEIGELKPGTYMLHRLNRLFNTRLLIQRELAKAFVLTREGPCIYEFPSSYQVRRHWHPGWRGNCMRHFAKAANVAQAILSRITRLKGPLAAELAKRICSLVREGLRTALPKTKRKPSGAKPKVRATQPNRTSRLNGSPAVGQAVQKVGTRSVGSGDEPTTSHIKAGLSR
jgi:hypothetical protein